MRDDKEWFSENVLECQESLYILAYSILRGEEDAKDAVQEAIWRAYENLDSLREQSKFRPWIMKILSNTAYSMLRQRRQTFNIDEQEDIPAPENGADVNTRISLWEAVEKLEMPYRQVVVLYYYERFSVKEISGMLDSRPDTIRKRLSRAREMLRCLIDRA